MPLSQYSKMSALSQPLCLQTSERSSWKSLGSDTVSLLPWFWRVCIPAQLIASHGLRCPVTGTLQPWSQVVFTSTVANDISYLSINRSKLSDGSVLGPYQIVKQGKRKLVRSSNKVNVRKRIWPNYRHPLQISLCLELKGTFFVLQMPSWKIEFIAF